MTDVSITISTFITDRHALVTVAGEVDHATAPAVETATCECIDNGAVLVAVDMSATTFMACAGINALISARTYGLKARAAVGVIRPSEPVARILHLCDVDVLLLGPTTPNHPTHTWRGPSPTHHARRPEADPYASGDLVATALGDALARVKQLESTLTTRGVIARAQGILMERYQLDEDAAFAVLKRASSNLNIPIRDIAAQFITTGHLPREVVADEEPKRSH